MAGDKQNLKRLLSESLMLPADARNFVVENLEQIDNWALKQNRLFYKTGGNPKWKYVPILWDDVFCSDEKKGKQSELWCELSFLNDIIRRNKHISENLWSEQWGKLVYKPDKAFILGTGAESVYSSIPIMTLHPVYGIPYIPSSGLKGVVRNYYILKYYGADENKASQDKRFQYLFGYKAGEDGGGAGKIVFLDSFPLTPPVLYYETFTPHYAEYYRGKRLTDSDSPIPLSFPAIKDTSYEILFGTGESDGGSYIEELKKDIPEALSWIGIGGKTAIGYGLGTAKGLVMV